VPPINERIICIREPNCLQTAGCRLWRSLHRQAGSECDALTLQTAGDNPQPIVFSEWSLLAGSKEFPSAHYLKIWKMESANEREWD
jgi:hypothetical protein